MRRHYKTTTTDSLPYKHEGSARIDPHDLSKYFHSDMLRKKAVDLTGKEPEALFGADGPGHVQIRNDHVLVECRLESGLPLIVKVPFDHFKGVGARFTVSLEDGNPVICILELVHRDAQLTIPVLVSADLEDAAIDWQSWSSRYNLAMLHKKSGIGDYEPISIDGMAGPSILIEAPQPRRYHAQFAARRPRFLSRRKPGQSGNMVRFEDREIIARN